MGAYHYQALDNLGQTSKGIIEADSERHARQLLRDKAMLPTQIQALTKQASSHKSSLGKKDKLTAQELSLFTRQLATLIAAGMPVEESLRGVSEQAEKARVRELIIGVRSKVLEGYSLAQAMNAFPQSFPDLYRATVGAGEQTGRLDLVLEKLADYTEHQQATKQKIQQALLYPSLMLLVSIGIIAFLLSFVVPKIIEVFTHSGQTLPTMTKVLIAISHFTQTYGLTFFFIIFALIIAFKQSLRNLKIRTMWHQFLLKLPLTAYLLKSVNVSRYIHTFGILFAAGVSVLETMRVSASLLTNVIMNTAFDTATTRVREGKGISEALKATGFLNPMTTHLISSGEKSGQISNMMERAAANLDQEIKRLIDTGLTLLEPLVILFMGGVVLFIVLAILLPIFSMEQLVK